MRERLQHYQCSRCGRLCSVPWDPPVWCLHHDSTFTPHGPKGENPGWAIMDPFDAAADTERYRRELDARREQISMLEEANANHVREVSRLQRIVRSYEREAS